ncbi:unknown [Crocosphaera subtropica ATCC 51142]|uniref:Uncharacterized protein n=1 Tax=Crocosphaera subtropica (strain ATCC 51142 / BH68) TaxID=43989 RepID=B1WZG8_CROS5|nr:unknown [Crocosphaera subtropica ATCC 51142]
MNSRSFKRCIPGITTNTKANKNPATKEQKRVAILKAMGKIKSVNMKNSFY